MEPDERPVAAAPVSLYQEVNERIRELAARAGGAGLSQYLCECDDRRCEKQVGLSLAEYDAIRASGNGARVLAHG